MIQTLELDLEMENLEWNIHHPFDIHPSESPNQPLAKVVQHGGHFLIWSRDVRRSLYSKNKLCLIEESSVVITPKFCEKHYDAWKQANDMVIYMVAQVYNSTIKQSVMWINTA